MDRSFFTIAFLAVFASSLSAQIQLPWENSFRMPETSWLNPSSRDTFSTKSQVYDNYMLHKSEFSYRRYLNETTWISPSFHVLDETFGGSYGTARQIYGSVAAGRTLNRWLDLELLGSPQYFSSRSESEVKFEQYQKVGGGIKIKMAPYLTLYNRNCGIYSHTYSDTGSMYKNPGWETSVSGISGLDGFLSDTLRLAGEIIKESREYGNGLHTNLFILGKQAILGKKDTIHASLSNTVGNMLDDTRLLNEEKTVRSLTFLYKTPFIKFAESSLFWIMDWEKDRYLRSPIQNYAKTGYRTGASLTGWHRRYYWTGLFGYGQALEDMLPENGTFSSTAEDTEEARKNLFDNTQKTIWMEGFLLWRPYDLWTLQWRGYGKKHSTDYNNFLITDIDTVSHDYSNDYIRINHWLKSGLEVAPSCSLFMEGEYTNEITQYILARSSGSNYTRNIYAFRPAVFWQFLENLYMLQNFEILANYSRSPFFSSNNSLFRQLRSRSSAGLAASSLDSLLLSFEYIHYDEGSIPSLDYYEIEKKGIKTNWTAAWKRKLFSLLYWKPGIGWTNNTYKKYLGGLYRVLDSISGNSWIYSLDITRVDPRGPALSVNMSYIRESTGHDYWNATGTVKAGF